MVYERNHALGWVSNGRGEEEGDSKERGKGFWGREGMRGDARWIDEKLVAIGSGVPVLGIGHPGRCDGGGVEGLEVECCRSWLVESRV